MVQSVARSKQPKVCSVSEGGSGKVQRAANWLGRRNLNACWHGRMAGDTGGDSRSGDGDDGLDETTPSANSALQLLHESRLGTHVPSQSVVDEPCCDAPHVREPRANFCVGHRYELAHHVMRTAHARAHNDEALPINAQRKGECQLA